jgi:hypothetical protein
MHTHADHKKRIVTEVNWTEASIYLSLEHHDEGHMQFIARITNQYI